MMTASELSEVARLFRTPNGESSICSALDGYLLAPVDLSLAEPMGKILTVLVSLHSLDNFKIHTLASCSRCDDLGIH